MATVKVGGGTSGTGPGLDTRIQMPGPVSDVRYDSARRFVQVLGARADGSPTVYTIEPHGNAVFQDAALPWTPSAWALDQAPDYPSADRQQLLLFSHDGTTASVDVGKTAFSWRLPGVLAGVLTAALLYLLTRLLFFRRGQHQNGVDGLGLASHLVVNFIERLMEKLSQFFLAAGICNAVEERRNGVQHLAVAASLAKIRQPHGLPQFIYAGQAFLQAAQRGNCRILHNKPARNAFFKVAGI